MHFKPATILQKLPFALVFFILAFGILASFINTNDTRAFNLQQAGIEALVERHHYYVDGSDTAEFKNVGDTVEFESHVYPAKQPGQFFIGAAVYSFLRAFGITYKGDYFLTAGLVTLLTSALMTAVMMTLVLLIAQDITKNTISSMIIALFYGFGTIALPYAGVTHHEVHGTFISLLAFYLLYRTYHSTKTSQFSIGISGFLSGLALFMSAQQLVNMAINSSYVVLHKRWKHIAIYGICFIIGLLPTFAFNYAVFNHPLAFPITIGNKWTDSMPHIDMKNIIEKIDFYVLSPTTAIIFYSPIFIIALLGFALLPRTHRIEKYLLPLSFVLLVPYLALFQTNGGCQYGPRYLLPSMPFIIIGLAGFFARYQKKHTPKSEYLLAGIILVGIASVAINITGALMGTMYCNMEVHGLIGQLRPLLSGQLPGYLFRQFGIQLAALAGAVILQKLYTSRSRALA